MNGEREATCPHVAITTYGDGEGGPRLWACADCRVRFYPACPTCVDVGHRNIDHPALTPQQSQEAGERRRASLTLNGKYGAGLWLGKRLVARIVATVEDSRVTPEEPEPRWLRDARVFVRAVNAAQPADATEGRWIEGYADGLAAGRQDAASSNPDRETLDVLDGLATAVIRMKLAIPTRLGPPVLPAEFFAALGDVNQWLDRNDRVQSRALLTGIPVSDTGKEAMYADLYGRLTEKWGAVLEAADKAEDATVEEVIEALRGTGYEFDAKYGGYDDQRGHWVDRHLDGLRAAIARAALRSDQPPSKGRGMSRLAILVAAVAGFVAGAIAMLELVDRLLGGDGPDIELADEPGGGW